MKSAAKAFSLSAWAARFILLTAWTRKNFSLKRTAACTCKNSNIRSDARPRLCPDASFLSLQPAAIGLPDVAVSRISGFAAARHSAHGHFAGRHAHTGSSGLHLRRTAAQQRALCAKHPGLAPGA